MLIKAGTQFIATGFVGKDAETIMVGSKNTKCVKFGFKAAEKPVPNGEPEPVWVNVSCFGKVAERSQNIVKGDIVFVSGTVSLTTGNDGKQYTNFTADYVNVMGDKPITANTINGNIQAALVTDINGDFELADGDTPF